MAYSQQILNPMPPERFCMVFCTCPDTPTASQIGATLVREKLAACVNLLPNITSIYQWQGKIIQDNETQLLIKTRQESFEQLSARIVALHPYELPEILSVSIADGLPDYLTWISHATEHTHKT